MRVAICDDNKEHAHVLEELLIKQDKEKVECDVFESGEEFLYKYEKSKEIYDAVFLDMEMGGLSGIETAEYIRKCDRDIVVVFVTSHRKYMEESFKCSPFRFLTKPIMQNKFDEMFNALCIKLNDRAESFIFTENRSKTRISCDNVLFIKSESHDLFIHTKDGKVHQTRKSLVKVMEEVDSNKFVQTYRSYVVNVKYIYKINDNQVILINCNEDIPLSETYKSQVEDAMINYKERKYIL